MFYSWTVMYICDFIEPHSLPNSPHPSTLVPFLSRCCRIVPRPVGKWSSTGGHHLVPTLCASLMSMRTSIRAGSVCLLWWSGEYAHTRAHTQTRTHCVVVNKIIRNECSLLSSSQKLNCQLLDLADIFTHSESRYSWVVRRWRWSLCQVDTLCVCVKSITSIEKLIITQN